MTDLADLGAHSSGYALLALHIAIIIWATCAMCRKFHTNSACHIGAKSLTVQPRCAWIWELEALQSFSMSWHVINVIDLSVVNYQVGLLILGWAEVTWIEIRLLVMDLTFSSFRLSWKQGICSDKNCFHRCNGVSTSWLLWFTPHEESLNVECSCKFCAQCCIEWTQNICHICHNSMVLDMDCVF